MHGGFYVLYDEALENSEKDTITRGEDDDTMSRRRSVLGTRGGPGKAEWR